MIERYAIKEISAIWCDHNRFATYLKVELAVLEALGDSLPPDVLPTIRRQARINLQRIQEIEQLTRHDMIAFCTSITEDLEPQVGKYFHYGVTSSDIIDTSLALMMKESAQWVQLAVEQLKAILWQRANQYRHLVAMGRSHGIYGEPLSFGQKLLGFYRELERRERDLGRVYSEEFTGQISGAMGNYTLITRQTEGKDSGAFGVGSRAPFHSGDCPGPYCQDCFISLPAGFVYRALSRGNPPPPPE